MSTSGSTSGTPTGISREGVTAIVDTTMQHILGQMEQEIRTIYLFIVRLVTLMI
jgi:hypothetical protein